MPRERPKKWQKRQKKKNNFTEEQLYLSKVTKLGSSRCGTVEENLTSIHKDVGLIPGLAQWVGDLVLLGAVV